MSEVREGQYEELPADYPAFIHALRSIGYSFEEAVADVIDNSIEAEASAVQVRFVIRETGHVDLLIADNGCGMDAARLREAMRFGSAALDKQKRRLGLFGIGLKLASIAHAENLHVASMQKSSAVVGRAWTDEGLKRGFYCLLLSAKDLTQVTHLSSLPRASRQGTWVLWQTLFRFSFQFDRSAELCDKLLRSLRDYLGLHLHRFLGRVSVTIDVVDEKKGAGAPRTVEAFDPFGYGKSAYDDYPAVFEPSGEYAKTMSIKAHIWPANSQSKNYMLPGGAVRRQGFYFYRNDRLLSGGGWHGIKDGLDTHDSLGRVEVHLNIDVEREANVDVKKAVVKLTPQLREAILHAENKDGLTFRKFLADVNKAYRRKNIASSGAWPHLPGKGYPKHLAKEMAVFLGTQDERHHKQLEFAWKKFPANNTSLFLLDRKKSRCLLNEKYRRALLRRRTSTKYDLALLKTMLFMLIVKQLETGRLTDKQQQYLDALSKLLGKAADFEGLTN